MDNLLIIPGPTVKQKRSISRVEHYYSALDAFCVLVADVRRYHAKNVSHPGNWTALEHKLLGDCDLTKFPSRNLHNLSEVRQIMQQAFALLSSMISLRIYPRIFTSNKRTPGAVT
ncbi:hypothetical protein LTR56_012995 [Elasticomyces elasticus]|nr:hypothetical protein LTR56_012995 [Elasticomyces elasticus]KAK3649279.1 hypothetical protein LTR22_013008 [Elasticomyces elasticus]KAK4928187.1 hypothetical protein LTR49_005125 [Elasticomyces elasticus]KAK5765941.1 hypothetical protein LTS12_003948 [Elasticomyces elasticus]